MTNRAFEKMLNELAAAWECRDYSAAAAAFVEDIKYSDPIRYSFRNRTELQAFFEDDEGYPQRTVWHIIVFDEQKQAGAAEYTYDGTHRYHGVVLIKIAGEKVIEWREYQHIDPREWTEFAGPPL